MQPDLALLAGASLNGWSLSCTLVSPNDLTWNVSPAAAYAAADDDPHGAGRGTKRGRDSDHATMQQILAAQHMAVGAFGSLTSSQYTPSPLYSPSTSMGETVLY